MKTTKAPTGGTVVARAFIGFVELLRVKDTGLHGPTILRFGGSGRGPKKLAAHRTALVTAEEAELAQHAWLALKRRGVGKVHPDPAEQ